MSGQRQGEPSAEIRVRVQAARERQLRRFTGTHLMANADMSPAEIRQYCQLDEAGNSLMKVAVRQMQLTARGYHRVLKLARTIADLAGEAQISQTHLAEALQYRAKTIEG